MIFSFCLSFKKMIKDAGSLQALKVSMVETIYNIVEVLFQYRAEQVKLIERKIAIRNA